MSAKFPKGGEGMTIWPTVYNISKSASKDEPTVKVRKGKWGKVDKDLYVAQGMQQIRLSTSSMGSLDNTVVKFIHILEKSAEIAAPTKVQRFRRPKLRIWTPEISAALTQKKVSFREWKLRGRPQETTDPLLLI